MLRHSHIDIPKRDLKMRFAFERSEKPHAAINSPIGAFDLTALAVCDIGVSHLPSADIEP
jgi:hypothetical protein